MWWHLHSRACPCYHHKLLQPSCTIARCFLQCPPSKHKLVRQVMPENFPHRCRKTTETWGQTPSSQHAKRSAEARKKVPAPTESLADWLALQHWPIPALSRDPLLHSQASTPLSSPEPGGLEPASVKKTHRAQNTCLTHSSRTQVSTEDMSRALSSPDTSRALSSRLTNPHQGHKPCS